MYTCPICGNNNELFISVKPDGSLYCRKCVSFRGKKVTEEIIQKGIVVVNLKYRLTKEQQQVSKQILNNYIHGKNSLIYAVCGAGKTELVFETIAYCLSNGLQVGFAVPRKDVVIELGPRLKSAFPSNKVIEIFGSHTKCLAGDIIVLTTHQLYRFEKYFDLLILDEIDAFPYKDNNVLISLFKRSVRGRHILMSATPSTSLIKEYDQYPNKLIKLFVRYHHKQIPVPKVVILFGILKIIYLIIKIKKFARIKKQILIFVPTIDDCENLFLLLRFVCKNGSFVHSKCLNRADIISKFKNKELFFLISTAVLERGVTIKDVQVIVFNSDHGIYNSQSLIQISGRVGRDKKFPNGEVIFLANKKTKSMEEAIDEIAFQNEHLQNLS